jgi:putative flippase GtrA
VSARTATGRHRNTSLGQEATGFAAVGAVALAVDIGGYNALVHLSGTTWLDEQPLVAKTVSVTASTTVAYIGNRFWTYRHRPRGRLAREYTLFLLLSAIALAIALGCLAFSRYVLDLSSPLADNVAANGVGLALGSLFRFLTYRRWVFQHPPPDRHGGNSATAGSEATGQEVEGDVWVRRRTRVATSLPQRGSVSAASSTGDGDRRN